MNKRQAKKNSKKKQQANTRKKQSKPKVVLTQQEKQARYNHNRLKYRVQREVRTANNRLKGLAENGFKKSSNAYRYLERQLFDGNKFLEEKTDKNGNKRIGFKFSIRNASWNDLQAIEKLLTKFLTAKTSTTRGVRKAYTNAYESFKESTGTDLTEQQYSEQFASGLFQQYSKLYSSSQASEFFSTARKNGLSADEIQKILDNEEENKIQTPHRQMLKELQRARENDELNRTEV